MEKEAQTLPKVKRWVSQSMAPMLAVIYAEHPGGQAWLERQIIAGKRRWKNKHRGLLKKETPSSSKQDAGDHAGAPSKGGRGCRKTPPSLSWPMLLTVKELAAWLNIKPSTLYLWAAHDKIPCRKIHGLIRFERDVILRWLDSFTGEPLNLVCPIQDRNPSIPVDDLIARAKRDVYTFGHGETITPSPIGKE